MQRLVQSKSWTGSQRHQFRLEAEMIRRYGHGCAQVGAIALIPYTKAPAWSEWCLLFGRSYKSENIDMILWLQPWRWCAMYRCGTQDT